MYHAKKPYTIIVNNREWCRYSSRSQAINMARNIGAVRDSSAHAVYWPDDAKEPKIIGPEWALPVNSGIGF